MESVYKTKLDHYYNLFEDAVIEKECVKIFENYYEIHNVRLDSSGCNCCGVKYNNIFIDGAVYMPYKQFSPDNKHSEPVYKKYKYCGPLSPYYIMCKQFSNTPSIKDFLFRCQYGNERFDNRVVSEKDVQIVDANFKKSTSIYYVKL